MVEVQRTRETVKNNLGVYVVPAEVSQLLEQMKNGTLKTLMNSSISLDSEIQEIETEGSEVIKEIFVDLDVLGVINEDIKRGDYNSEHFRHFFKEYNSISNMNYSETFGISDSMRNKDFRVGGPLHRIYEILKGKFIEEEVKYSIAASDYSKNEMVYNHIFQWIKLYGSHGNIEETFPGIFQYWDNSGLIEKGQLLNLIEEANIQRSISTEKGN